MADATSDQTSSPEGSDRIQSFADLDEKVDTFAQIPVAISFDIIRLFSEGLYQSPQKAIEELVSNSYDANATAVHVLLPDTGRAETERLWVVDNGDGLDLEGFRQLWKIAESQKANQDPRELSRAPIGQFGIGKLASYVLARRLVHISKVGNQILATSMNFHRVEQVHQNDANLQPLQLDVKALSGDQAGQLLADIAERDPQAWGILFGPNAAPRWTVAGLSDFKDLYRKLSSRRLEWVLRTALPLVTDFKIYLDKKELTSSKISGPVLVKYTFGGLEDQKDIKTFPDAISVGEDNEGTLLTIDGITDAIRGEAVLYQDSLTKGKSDRWDRSNGFFIRVRGRIINIDDELFGLPALNHATWSRFVCSVDADGLRTHLLSSREGVRESDPIELLRWYLGRIFNKCRAAYENWLEEQDAGANVNVLLEKAPSAFVVEPLIDAVTQAISSGRDSFYVASVPDLTDEDQESWLSDYATKAAERPFADIQWQSSGEKDRALRYRPDTRTLLINEDHPFIAKLLATERKSRVAAQLFASSEFMVDILLQEHGFDSRRVFDLLSDRDRVLRLVAGERPTTAAEVLRLLKSANEHETALERAVGLVFRVLGFEYQRKGGNKGGADGILDGRLGRLGNENDDFRLVYDAKQTKEPRVPADKIDPSSLWSFKVDEKADFAFFLAIAYDAEDSPTGKVNKKVLQSCSANHPVTLLKVDHLRRLVELHYRFGLTLLQLRALFQTAHTVPEVEEWLDALETELTSLAPRVPLLLLLEQLEAAKQDALAVPTVTAARLMSPDLALFRPERLRAALQAVREIVGERFLEVDDTGFEVRLHTTASQIVAEVNRSLLALFGPSAGVLPDEWPSADG